MKIGKSGILLLMVLMLLSVSQTTVRAAERNTIAAQGRAVIKVVPDMAHVNLSISIKGDTAAEAREKLAAKLKELRFTIYGLGVTPEAVESTSYNLQPYTYSLRNGQLKQKGFIGSSSATIKVHALTKLADVIDRSLKLAEVNVEGVYFGLNDRNAVERNLLRDAVNNAREKASMVASAGGRNLGSLLSADISSRGEARLEMPRANMEMLKSVGAADTRTELNPGTMQIEASVSTVWNMY